nr:MAG TPA: hypothetical protein [Inoviridae sp.]
MTGAIYLYERMMTSDYSYLYHCYPVISGR